MPYIVMEASAQIPSSCKGIYRRCGVVEIEPGAQPKMLSPRARGVIRVVRTWERRHAGSGGPNTAFSIALQEAEELAEKLNRGA